MVDIIEINQDGIPIILDHDQATNLASSLVYAVGKHDEAATKIIIHVEDL
jgi:hypothetical protein